MLLPRQGGVGLREAKEMSRRSALRALGFGSAVAAAGAGLINGGTAWAGPSPILDTATTTTVQQWMRGRGPNYYVAHRGSGDVYPEHSMAAYQAAVDAGAACMEISVQMTSDGVLICMHDFAYDRTTTATGLVRAQSSAVLDTARIWQPWLGASWTVDPPRIPLFEDVLKTYGGRVVLAVEAKLDAAYVPMMAMVQRYGLQESVIVKTHFKSPRWAQAKQAGYPVFCYFGAVADMTPDAIRTTSAQLDPLRDCLVIPGVNGSYYVPDSAVTAAVDTGVPVWVYPLHRRADAQHFFDLGAQGAICSSYGYIAGALSPVTADSWANQAIAAGEMSRNPATGTFAPQLSGDGELALAAKGSQHFITVGQLGSVSGDAGSYSIGVDVSWPTPPISSWDNISVAFGRADDSYYQHRQGKGNGYHAIMRANGSLGLYRHRDGQVAGELLAPEVDTPALRTGEWASLRVDVTPSSVTLSRTDTGAAVIASGIAPGGGYVHLGRSSTNGVAAFRALSVT
jgi:glycerophosphoryl diester phosphodiesterase